MNKQMQRLFLVLMILVLAVSLQGQTVPAASQAGPKRLFWKVTSPTTEVYFLGSIHVATDDMYPLPPEIEKAYQESKSLAVEADVTKGDQTEIAMAAMQRGMYTGGDTLDKHVSAETMKSLEKFCSTAGMPVELMKTMKPVMAAMLVEASFVEKQGLDPKKGIDMHFLTQANASKKNIVELESTDAQLNLLFSIDDKLADKWLSEMLKENSTDELNKAVKAWKEGDEKALDEATTGDEKKDPDALKMNELMLYSRNVGMTKKVEDMLKGTEKTFVVVGAAHLIGEKGVLKALEAKGYKVERPALTDAPKP